MVKYKRIILNFVHDLSWLLSRQTFHVCLVCLAAVGFFLAVSSYNFVTQTPDFGNRGREEFIKWGSPDETANYVFTKLYAQAGRLSFFEPLNLSAQDIIHSRSMRSDHGEIKPVSFLGMIIAYGQIGALLGYRVIPYLTPLFAAIAIVYYYLLVRELFGRTVALMSAIALAFFPVWIYYSARSMFHNVPFVATLTIGLYYGVRSGKYYANPRINANLANREYDPQSNSINQIETEESKRYNESVVCCSESSAENSNEGDKGYGFLLSSRAEALRSRGISLWRSGLKGSLHFAPLTQRDSGRDDKKSSRSYVTLLRITTKSAVFRMALKEYLPPVLCGVFLGLAITFRTSELLWLGPLLVFLWIFNIRRIGLIKLILILSGMLIALAPTLYWNTVLFGSPTSGGYPQMNQSIASVSQSGTSLLSELSRGRFEAIKTSAKTVKDTIFHFGFHPRQSARMFEAYFIKMFPLVFWPAALGFFLLLADYPHWSKKRWLFLVGGLFVSAVLVVYYGSWQFFDNPDKSRFTIGNSYTRYWLPIYMFALPLAVYSFTLLMRGRFIKYIGYAMAAFALIFYAGQSIRFVLLGSEEGLILAARKSQRARQEYRDVLNLTPANSTIITAYHDKLLFPERKVLVGLLTDQNMNRIYAHIAEKSPLYYYNFTLPSPSVAYLNERKLGPLGLSLFEVDWITDDFSLYKLDLLPL